MAKSALLVIDVQRGIMDLLDKRVSGPLLTALTATVAAARTSGIPIIHVHTVMRPGYPEVSERNPIFQHLQKLFTGGSAFTEGDESAESHPAVAPLGGDIMIAKRRVSAFAGTDLEIVLRSQGIEQIVIAGVATGSAVLSTVRQASDMDYRITVLKDLCADRDPEVHEVLMNKVFLRQATVMNSTEWLSSL